MSKIYNRATEAEEVCMASGNNHILFKNMTFLSKDILLYYAVLDHNAV